MNLYLDTSAIIKRYVIETGTPDVQVWISSAHTVSTSLIARVETIAVFARMVRMGILSRQVAEKSMARFRTDWTIYQRIPVSDALVERADHLAWQLVLRGSDAVHLAAALTWQDHLQLPLTMVTYDRELWHAAKDSGLLVLPEQLA